MRRHPGNGWRGGVTHAQSWGRTSLRSAGNWTHRSCGGGAAGRWSPTRSALAASFAKNSRSLRDWARAEFQTPPQRRPGGMRAQETIVARARTGEETSKIEEALQRRVKPLKT